MPLKMESWPIIGSRENDLPNQKRKKRNISFLGVKDRHAITYRYKKEIEPFFVEIC